jgi:ABC-type cobalamin/Fe3+-siderophores transport system ATPase subunit
MTLDDEPMLRAVDLTLGYPKAEAVVKRVSIELRKGRVFSIAGPNGAGKSTLLATLAGIAKPKSGHVLFMGRRVRRATEVALRPRPRCSRYLVSQRRRRLKFFFGKKNKTNGRILKSKLRGLSHKLRWINSG